jgi:enoyl-CoA hydratase
MSNAMEIEQHGSATVIRFIRPEIRNPLSVFVLEELGELIAGIEANCSRLIFTGTGNVFASGADLREIACVTADGAREFALRGQKLLHTIASLNCKTIAAVNGFCFGGALDLALACDVRIAAPSAQFSHPGVGLGIVTGWGGTQRLPRLVGEARALEMFFTAGRVDANEALRIGLIDKIAEDVVSAALD